MSNIEWVKNEKVNKGKKLTKLDLAYMIAEVATRKDLLDSLGPYGHNVVKKIEQLHRSELINWANELKIYEKLGIENF